MTVPFDHGAQVDAPDSYGMTPLMYSAVNQTTNQAYKPLKLLLRHGAGVNLRDPEGATALMYAAESGQLPYLIRLLEAGADSKLRDEYGRTAYDIAISGPDSRRHRKITELRRRHME